MAALEVTRADPGQLLAEQPGLRGRLFRSLWALTPEQSSGIFPPAAPVDLKRV